MTIKRNFLKLHRWVSLAALVFWFVQALTGVLIIFHWEMNDASLAGDHHPVDLIAIEKTVEELEAASPDHHVTSIWTSASGSDRFDISVDAQPSFVVRVDGAGNILRTRYDGERFSNGGWVDTLVVLHHNLLGGDVGSWIVGLSGLLLLSNLLMGLFIAWPAKGQWRRAIFPSVKGGKAAHRYVWHRALGLWVALPAIATISAGIMLVFGETTTKVVNPAPVEAEAVLPDGRPLIGLAQATASAKGAFPDAALSGISFPSNDNASYRFRLLQSDEVRRAYGTTTVYVNALDGSIIASFDALEASNGRAFVDGIFPFHTGEFGGLWGRIANMAIGLWLMVMIVLGIQLWWSRRGRA